MHGLFDGAMPTFTAVAFDRLFEPRASISMAAGTNVPPPKLDRRNSTPASIQDRGISAPKPKPQRRNSATAIDTKHNLAGISPALYATPESTPLPDSPSSFPPSPYIVNHKRRGPRLLKSYSEDDVAVRKRAQDEDIVVEIAKNAKGEVVDSGKDVDLSDAVPSSVQEQQVNVVHNGEIGSTIKEERVNGVYDGELGSNELPNGLTGHNSSMKSVTFDTEGAGESDDFFDPQDSMSVKSNTEVESNSGMDRSLNLATPLAEFYDAWEELSSESGHQPQPPPYDIEAELHEIRLSLLMEIEKRKQAEEALDKMRSHWLKIQEELSSVGLKLPADPIAVLNDEQVADPAEELCRQVHLARFVSNSIGRGTAKAEVEEEMEAQMELKNFEIARLVDRLHYYEAVNQEMSQRNQETVEVARRLRQKRKRRQRWIWGSIGAAITLGGAALAWSYLPSGKGSSSADDSHATKGDHSS